MFKYLATTPAKPSTENKDKNSNMSPISEKDLELGRTPPILSPRDSHIRIHPTTGVNTMKYEELDTPVLDVSLITKAEYIPLELAESTLIQANTSLQTLQKYYNEYIIHMKTQHQHILTSIQSHYETYITDLKQKSLQHILHQKEQKKKIVEKYTKQLDVLSSHSEEYRDSLYRQIKKTVQNNTTATSKIHDIESYNTILLKKINDYTIQYGCIHTIDSIISQIETKLTRENTLQESADQINHYEIQVDSLQQTIQNQSHTLQITQEEYHTKMKELESNYQSRLDNLQFTLDTLTQQYTLDKELLQRDINRLNEENNTLDIQINQLQLTSSQIQSQTSLRERLHRVCSKYTRQYQNEQKRVYTEKITELELQKNELIASLQVQEEKNQQLLHNQQIQKQQMSISNLSTFKDSVLSIKLLLDNIYEDYYQSPLSNNSNCHNHHSETQSGRNTTMSTKNNIQNSIVNNGSSSSRSSKTHRIDDKNNAINTSNTSSSKYLDHDIQTKEKSNIYELVDLSAFPSPSSIQFQLPSSSSSSSLSSSSSSRLLVSSRQAELSYRSESKESKKGIDMKEEDSVIEKQSEIITLQIQQLHQYYTTLHSLPRYTPTPPPLQSQSSVTTSTTTADSNKDINTTAHTSTSTTAKKMDDLLLSLPLNTIDMNVPNSTTTSSSERKDDSVAVSMKNNDNIVKDAGSQQTMNQYIQAMALLEEEVLNLRESNSKLSTQFDVLNEEKKTLYDKFQDLLKEKRGDVIQSYEEKFNTYKIKEREYIEQLQLLQATQMKLEAMNQEWKERAEHAEQELKERDRQELSQMNPTEQTYELKTIIGQQRDEIVIKSKAATSATEEIQDIQLKLKMDKENAYQRGVTETESALKQDMTLLHQTIEEKDMKMASLVQQLYDAEIKYKEIQESHTELIKEYEVAKVDLQDMMTHFSSTLTSQTAFIPIVQVNNSTTNINDTVLEKVSQDSSSSSSSSSKRENMSSASSSTSSSSKKRDTNLNMEVDPSKTPEALSTTTTTTTTGATPVVASTAAATVTTTTVAKDMTMIILSDDIILNTPLVQKLQVDINESQHELVVLSNKNDTLQETVDLLEDKIQVYEQMIRQYEQQILTQSTAAASTTQINTRASTLQNGSASISGVNKTQGNTSVTSSPTKTSIINNRASIISPSNTTATTNSNGSAGGSVNSSEALVAMTNKAIQLIKNSVNKGSAAWKNNKKDECYNIYMTTIDDLQKLFSPVSSTSTVLNDMYTIANIAYTNNKDTSSGGGGGNGGSKPKLAVQLRKTLDQLMTMCTKLSSASSTDTQEGGENLSSMTVLEDTTMKNTASIETITTTNGEEIRNTMVLDTNTIQRNTIIPNTTTTSSSNITSGVKMPLMIDSLRNQLREMDKQRRELQQQLEEYDNTSSFLSMIDHQTVDPSTTDADVVSDSAAERKGTEENSVVSKSGINEDTKVNINTLIQEYTDKKNNNTQVDEPLDTTTATTASGDKDNKKKGSSSSNTNQSSAVLLKRAQVAERKLELLVKQLAVASSSSTTTASGTATSAVISNPNNATATTITTTNNNNNTVLELRRAQRKIKELEMKVQQTALQLQTTQTTLTNTLKTVAASTGNTGTTNGTISNGHMVGDNITTTTSRMSHIKSAAGGGANEKQYQKKLKELETSYANEKTSYLSQISSLESQLLNNNVLLEQLTTERDQLVTETTQLQLLVSEIDSLRQVAGHAAEIEIQLKDKEKEYILLQDQFKKETTLRKKYKNELEDLKGSIRVYARCRPMAKYEIEKGCKTVVSFPDETSLKVVGSRGEKAYEFDAVFDMNSTQIQVFEDTKRLVESCIDGYNVCLFAYGQTGSGKTFTMTGSTDMPGLTPSAIYELFRLKTEKTQLTCRISTYFVELYNDNLVDLYYCLDHKGQKGAAANLEPPKLDIKMDDRKIVQIKNSIIKYVETPEELMTLFMQGNLERHVGATKMNAESSRSHSIFAVMVEAYDKTTKKTTFGKLSLVDLAGSERADKTGASAERLKEAQNINKSLSALGDVIAALSEGEKFIPYRNNKLTQLMQDSLGGNAKTLMFVNFSPADYNSDETVSSLSYAARVKKITNNAAKAAESEEIAKLRATIKRLQGGGGGGGSGGPVVVEEEEVNEDPPVPSLTDSTENDNNNTDYDYQYKDLDDQK